MRRASNGIGKVQSDKRNTMNVLFAIAAAGAFGVGDFLGGLAARKRPWLSVALTAQFSAFVLVTALAFVFSNWSMTTRTALWASLAGLSFAIGVSLLYRALGKGQMSRVAPITALFSISGPALFDLWNGRDPGMSALLGIVLAIPAIMLIGSNDEPTAGRDRGMTTTAVCAGLGLACFYICLEEAGSTGGLWTVVVARAVSFATIGLCLVIVNGLGKAFLPTVSNIAAAAGLLDGGATILVFLSTLAGPLAIAAAVSSFYPTVTILLALTILRENLSKKQKTGLCFAAISLFAILYPSI